MKDESLYRRATSLSHRAGSHSLPAVYLPKAWQAGPFHRPVPKLRDGQAKNNRKAASPSTLSRVAGVSAAGACRRNPEPSEGPLAEKAGGNHPPSPCLRPVGRVREAESRRFLFQVSTKRATCSNRVLRGFCLWARTTLTYFDFWPFKRILYVGEPYENGVSTFECAPY